MKVINKIEKLEEYSCKTNATKEFGFDIFIFFGILAIFVPIYRSFIFNSNIDFLSTIDTIFTLIRFELVNSGLMIIHTWFVCIKPLLRVLLVVVIFKIIYLNLLLMKTLTGLKLMKKNFMLIKPIQLGISGCMVASICKKLTQQKLL